MIMAGKSGTNLLGRYIVADPKICHRQPTFHGTRIFVEDVLKQVSSGMAWEAIIEEWNGNITKEAIAEAVQLATQALLRHAAKFVVETMSDGTPSHGGKEVQYIC